MKTHLAPPLASPMFSLNGLKLLICGAALSIAAISAQANNILISTGFEAPEWAVGDGLSATPLNGWTGNNVDGNRRSWIVDNQAHTGSQSLYLRDNASNYIAQAGFSLGQTVPQGSLGFWFKKGTGAQLTAGFYISFFDAAGTENFRVSVNDQFILGIPDVDSRLATEAFSNVDGAENLNDWNKLTIDFSQTDRTIKVLFNNVVVFDLDSEALSAAGDLSVASIRFNSGFYSGTGNSAVWIDDVVVTAIPEPSTVGIITAAIFLCYAAALRYRNRK